MMNIMVVHVRHLCQVIVCVGGGGFQLPLAVGQTSIENVVLYDPPPPP